MNRKIFIFVLTLLAQFSMPSWAMETSSDPRKVETIVVFFHGMGQSGTSYEKNFSPIKEVYKNQVQSGNYDPIEKGTFKAYFPDGKYDYIKFGKVTGKLWFNLSDNFSKDIATIKKELGRPLTKEELIEYLRPEETGLTAAVRENLEYVRGLMRKHELSAENVILIGYSQGGIVASLISQYLGNSCLGLILVNSLFMPAETPLSRPRKTYFAYSGKDNLISQDVYQVSMQSMSKVFHKNSIVVRYFPTAKHIIEMDLTIWILDTFNEILLVRLAIF